MTKLFSPVLPIAEPLPRDSRGYLIVTDTQVDLMQWIDPDCDDDDYALKCLRLVYRAPDCILNLVLDELRDRHYRKPLPSQLLRLCLVAMRIGPMLTDLGMTVDPYAEPPRKRRRRPRVHLDD